MEKTLEQLQQEASELRLALNKIEQNIEDYEIDQLHEKYGEDFCCEKCMYSAVLTFSGGGDHNKCGYPPAPCTCCNDYCQYYKPDNDLTLWVKENIDHISKESFTALSTLFLPFFKNGTPEEEELTKQILIHRYVNILRRKK